VSEYKFDHIHLMSPDPEKTAKFYQEMFGAKAGKPFDLGEGRVMLNVNLGGVTLLISKTTDEKQYGLSHIGISTPHLKEAVDELKADNVKFTLEITRISPDLTISFLQAPENMRLELTERGK
jgi:lactoylglutathione lyase